MIWACHYRQALERRKLGDNHLVGACLNRAWLSNRGDLCGATSAEHGL